MTQCTYLEAHVSRSAHDTFETRVWTHEQRPPEPRADHPPR